MQTLISKWRSKEWNRVGDNRKRVFDRGAHSPYLFIIYMTIMFADVKATLNGKSFIYRVEGAKLDEVLFADDTICISKSTAIMNKMIRAIEEIGQRSAMKLNKAKCEAMKYGEIADINRLSL